METNWLLLGNKGTDPTKNFLGTSDDRPLIFKAKGAEVMRVAPTGNVGIGNTNPQQKLDVNGSIKVDGEVWVGNTAIKSSGLLCMNSTSRIYTIGMDGDKSLMNFAHPVDGHYTVSIDGLNSKLSVGSVHIDGKASEVWVGNTAIKSNGLLGKHSTTGTYTIGMDADKSLMSFAHPVDRHYTVFIDGLNSKLSVGSVLIDGNANKLEAGSVHIDGKASEVWVGNTAIKSNGLLCKQSKSNYYTIGMDGDKSLMNFAHPVDGHYTVSIDGNAGDIILQNADCAEDFTVVAQVEAGTVMTLNDAGLMDQCTKPYDKRVTGVVSGAGDIKPALILGRQPDSTDRLPIALIGKVYCKVDASYAAVEIGDMLTTSSTPGHAMKVSDPSQAFGAVIGKALSPLMEGKGLIPILVALQ